MCRRKGYSVYEVGISYFGRTYKEGKKISVKDGFRALWCIFIYNTSYFAKLVKYFLTGLVVACSQFLTIFLLVDIFKLNDILKQNISYAISIFVSLTVAYVLHSRITWRLKSPNFVTIVKKLGLFYSVSAFSFGVRQVVFYFLSKSGFDYRLNTLIGICIAVGINFLGYDRIVFREKESPTHLL